MNELGLTRDEVVAGVLDEYRTFATVLRDLDDAAWTAPTRCDGWTVAHVAGHVVGQLDDLSNLRFAAAGEPDRQAEENFRRAPTEMADALDALLEIFAPTLGAFDDAAWATPIDPNFGDQTLGNGVLALWDDTYVHADDIREALGRDPDRGPALVAAIFHTARRLTEREWGPATLALDGMERIDVGRGGDVVTGDPYAFLMAATGRGDPAALGLDATVNVYADDA